jgi:putative transcriptional regulator
MAASSDLSIAEFRRRPLREGPRQPYKGFEVKNRLRELRKAQGWTQSELGDRLGISRQSVHSIEIGKYDPSLPLAFTISGLFGMPIEQIFEKSK